ncbi:MAG TPA: ABC transporter permease [Pyrinomonadaceae bacterium]|jgi:ribose transport system permease protein|nr:ABC transporter permease [Pyrinomonadaceae bacterium]
MNKELGIFVLLVVLCIALAILNPSFLTAANLQNLARLIGIYGIFSIGLGVVIITGGIDLSVGSVFALLGVLLSIFLVEWHVPSVIAVLLVIAISTSLGFVNGFLITKVKIQPFIVTLCGLLFYRGLARFIANDETKGFGSAEGFETLQSLATGSLMGIPTPFIILILISLVMWVVIHRSIYGRYLFAVGHNEVAARYSGINTDLIVTGAYVVCGLLAGIAGVLLAFYTNSISPSSHGSFYELYGIAAAVLGGCSLRGGEGSIIGILIGVALLQVLQNLVNLLGIPSSLNFAVMGAVILIGAIADQLLRQRPMSKLAP